MKTRTKKRTDRKPRHNCFYGYRGPSAKWQREHEVLGTDLGVPDAVPYERTGFAYHPDYERVGKIADHVPNAGGEP